MRSMNIGLMVLAFGINVLANQNTVQRQKSGLDLMTNTMLLAKAETKTLDLSGHDVDTSPYTVQVASYLSESDAVKHVEQLKKHEKSSFYFPTFTRGQVWFKVCSGRFATQGLAEKHRKTLVEKHEEAFAVVISLQNTNLDRKTASDTSTVGTPEMSVTLQKKDTVVATTATAPSTTGATTSGTAAVPKAIEEDYQYTVQVASFTKKSEADKRSANLTSEGNVEVIESQINGKTWYRVYLGTFETKREADAFRSVYAEKTGDTESFVKRLEK